MERSRRVTDYPAPPWNAEHAAVWRRTVLADLNEQIPQAARGVLAQYQPALAAALDRAEALLQVAYESTDSEAFALALSAVATLLGELTEPDAPAGGAPRGQGPVPRGMPR